MLQFQNLVHVPRGGGADEEVRKGHEAVPILVHGVHVVVRHEGGRREVARREGHREVQGQDQGQL